MTDDLGEYRIFELSAGRYTVQAKAAALTSVIEQRSFAYVPMFYPNAEDPRSALPLQLAAGQTQSRIDFQLRRVPTVSIQGRVAGADGSGQGLMVYLVPRAMAGRGAGMVEKEAIPVRAGRFALQGVLPGSYVLVAEQFGETGGAKLSARAALDIRDNDVQGVDLVLAPGADIRGRVQLEQGAAPVAQLGESTDQPVHVSLQPVGDEGALVGSTADGSGSFRLKDVRPGFYQIAVYDLRSGYYVKSIRAGDEDITEKGLDSTRGAIPGEIVVLVSPNGGTLAGTVQNDSAGKLGGVQVLAIPATERGHLLRGALTDQAGHFEIKGLAPGDYRVFAFEELEPGAAEDPDFIKKFANKSHPVTIKERGSETVDVPAIPSALTQADQ